MMLRSTHQKRTARAASAGALGGLWLIGSLATATEPTRLSFNSEVRPILSEHCFQCHGPDAKTRASELRLDVREGATAQLPSGSTAVVPGRPEASALMARIYSRDAETLMPPPHAKKPLTAAQKAVLRRWITEGAEYQGHWAFLPVNRPDPPGVRDQSWPRNPVDRFVLAELERRGLRPAPEADRATLFRRASLDVTGLPPTPEAVAEFAADTRPDAFDRAVDRLLDSPHYGERWARHWLDQARYADSNGYTIDGSRTMWPYRDWVIRALNQDMPFDQFTIEQIAGDLLPSPTKLQRLATAFHRNTMINEEGGTDPEQFRNEIVVDRVNTTGAVWLGLTVGCAQCHSHKYDPLSQREYFGLFAFFNSGTDVNSRGEVIDVLPEEIYGDPPPVGEAEIRAAKAAKARLDAVRKSAPNRQAEWEKSLAAAVGSSPANLAEPSWTPLTIAKAEARSNRGLQNQSDGSVLAAGGGASTEVYELTLSADASAKLSVAAIRLEALPHDVLPAGGPGLSESGDFILSEFEVLLDGKPLTFAHALAESQRPDGPITAAIDGSVKTGWQPGTRPVKSPTTAWFLLAEPVVLTGRTLVVRMLHEQRDHHILGRFRFSATAAAPTGHPESPLWASVTAALAKPAERRNKTDTAALARAFAETDRELAAAERAVRQFGGLSDRAVSVMVMGDRPKPRPTFVHIRGDFLSPDQAAGEVPPHTPSWLPPLAAVEAGRRPNRLDLARWLVSPDQPLTPRVTVNRVWMHYFGEGLVATENDFGTQGTPPTHPALLDWLADAFVRGGWSLKKMHRLILTSATYRQSSRHRPDLGATDPTNVLLARQARLRLDAEAIRDSSLAVAGLLDKRIGGPTVQPPQPDGVYAFTQRKLAWNVSSGSDRYRRTLYTTFYRSAPHPLFSNFDVPNLSTTCTRRMRSNTPLQALQLANDEVFVEAARALAVRLWREQPTDSAARVDRAFRLVLARAATLAESAAVLAFVDRQTARFAADETAARAVIGTSAAGQPPLAPVPALAAWTAAARALLNTDEFVTRE